MSKCKTLLSMIPMYFLILAGTVLTAICADHTIAVFADNKSDIINRKTIIIDPGHGGVDGGATSCTGILESQLNLDMSLRLRDILNFFGIRTIMIRTTDQSVYTQGTTISSKKVSDLKERVRIANNTPNAILLSIHQNHFSDPKYYGAQVFYASTDGSHELATTMQNQLINALNPDSHRKAKKADNIYLLKHVTCPAILIECGFLSNPAEESLLRSAYYQRKLCCVISAALSQSLYSIDQGLID